MVSKSKKNRLLSLSGESYFEIISLVDHADPLALWKYAKNVESHSRKTSVISFGSLAEYELYLSHGRSFYLSDDGARDHLMILDDLAVRLRSRVAKDYDRHGVLLPSERRFVEIIRMDSGSNHPLFFEKELNAGQLRFLVELENIKIWVLSSEDSMEPPYGSLCLHFGRAIAYWLWQLEPSLRSVLATLGEKLPVLELEFEIVPNENWFVGVQRSAGSEGISWRVGAEGRAFIRFAEAVCGVFISSDNAGDRHLVAHLVRLLFACRNRFAGRPLEALDGQVIQRIVEANAPLGRKRMIAMVRSESESVLSGNGLPPYRGVQAADQEELLDELALELKSLVLCEPGEEIPPNERVNLLREKVVPFFFRQLASFASTLRAEGLIEQLVARNEAILSEQMRHRLSLPARLACYSGEDGLEARIHRESVEYRKAAVASRFLIEFVVQQPPHGTDVLSLESYDRLLALSSAVFNWATTSDYVHYHLADLRITMLRSGRLGVSREDLERAQQAFGEDSWLQEVVAGGEAYSRHWREPAAVQDAKPPEVDEVDRCTMAEFGLSLTDLASFLGAVASFDFEVSGVVKTSMIRTLLQGIEQDLGWDREKVELAFDFFALKPRNNFLPVPPPFQKEDVYPWRFNRRLSYLRKPLLCQGEGSNAEVVWGAGQLEQSLEYLVNLCLGGRLKAQTNEMKRLISRTQGIAAKEFNDAVADAFEKEGFVVRLRVKKIGIHRLEQHGLGDIDVLVVAPSSGTILAVETKDLRVAKTPAEMDHELRDSFDPDTRSAAVKHCERIDWLRAHVEDTLTWLDLASTWSGEWRVEGCMVVSTALLSSYLGRCPVQVVPWVRLRKAMTRLLGPRIPPVNVKKD